MLEDFADISAQHVRLDYDAVRRSLVLTDLGSRNGTFLLDGDERAQSVVAVAALDGVAGEFGIGAHLRVRATLIDGEPNTAPLGKKVALAGPTIPYEQKTKAQVDDALEATVLSDVETAVEAYKLILPRSRRHDRYAASFIPSYINS